MWFSSDCLEFGVDVKGHSVGGRCREEFTDGRDAAVLTQPYLEIPVHGRSADARSVDIVGDVRHCILGHVVAARIVRLL